MDAINLDILKQLQEYAQMYFNAIVEANTTCGKCKFADGKYTAKDVMKWNYRQPEEDLYDEDVTLQSGTFKCKFPYRRIFEVLNDWESMSRAGKLKTVFEIGETETKSAKVLTVEKTALGAFKFKTMKLQRIAGNWWGPAKLPKCGQVWLYHETNGVMHIGGRQVFASELEDCPERIDAFCEKWNDEEFIKLMSKYNPGEDSEFNGYYTKVLELAGISVEATPQQPATPTETPQIVRVEIVRDFDGSYYANLYDANGNGYSLSEEYTGFRTLKTLCKKEYGICLPNLSQIEFENHGRKSYAYTSTETPQISTEAAETVNVSAEEEKEADTKEMPRYKCPNYADYAFERGWSIENTDFDPHSGVLCMIHFDPSDEKYVCGCLWQINSDKPNYTEHRRFKTLKGAQNYGTKRMGMKLEYQTLTVNCSVTPSEPPQSPGIPETAYHTTGPEKRVTEPRIKPRRTVRVLLAYPQKRVARNMSQGANYSTVNHIRGTTKMVYAPPGYSPPIRGGCTIRINRQTTCFKPP